MDMNTFLPVPGAGGVVVARRTGRARIACTLCHKRKVRCNSAIVGNPCSNCFQDGEECTLRVSNRGKRKRTRNRQDGDLDLDLDLNSNSSSPQYAAAAATGVVETGRRPQPRTGNDALSISAIVASTPPQPNASELTPAGIHMPADVEDQGEHVEWARYNARPEPHASHLVPFYCEDFIQSWGVIADDRNNGAERRGPHLWVPQRAPKPLGYAELRYLEAKGAFNLPSNELSEQLLDAYFTFVHPLLPIIEMKSFWEQYELQKPGNVSPLLLQSMFLAASSYLPSDLYKANGFSSAVALKEVFFDRAKALFDIGIEHDKIVLAQSALLMSYWYGNADNIAVCWHWIGIASSLCQDMGLHRNPIDNRVPESRRSLWRRVWWCCIHRDRWIALGLCRPMHTNSKDCDTQQLAKSDLMEETAACVGLSDRALATIERYRSVTNLFVQAVKLSACLGNIIACHLSPGPTSGLLEQIAECERELSTWYTELDSELVTDLSHNSTECSSAWVLQKHILNIFYNVVMITLHRLRLSDTFVEAAGNEEHLQSAREKCWSAASAATNSIRLLIDLNLICNLPPEIPTALVVIVSVLFTQRSWTTGLQQKAVAQKLDLCLLILAEIRDKHWAARSSLAYFTFALEQREGRSTNRGTRDPPPAMGYQTPETLGPDVSSLMGIDDFPSSSRWLYDLDSVDVPEDLMTAYSGLFGA